MLNNQINQKMFRESMDRCCSGVKADPFLAGRVIATEKTEKGSSRKLSVRFVCIVAALVVLATAAVAGIELARYRVWYGGEVYELTVPQIYEEKPETYPGINESTEELNYTMSVLMSEVPDDEYAEAWFEYSMDGVNTTRSIRVHDKIKVFTSFREFREYMANVEYLTIPSWIPEDVAEEDFYAEVQFGLKSEEDDRLLWQGFDERNEKVQLTEEREEGSVHFRRYRFDGAAEIIKGYSLSVYSKSLGSLNAHGEVSSDGGMFTIDEGKTASPVRIPGMDDSLLVISPEPEWPNMHDLLMRRNLDGAELFGKDVQIEEIAYASNDGTDPECMLKMFSGK